MKIEVSKDKINQVIIEGITVSAATASAHAAQYNIPLVVWVDDHIVEMNPSLVKSESN